MRPIVPPVLGAVCAVVLSACASAPRVPPSRDTPEATVELFKVMDRRRDWAGEWDLLSPALKQRLSARAGRNVDPGDYASARNAYRGDPRVGAAEQLLQTAQCRHIELMGDDLAYVTVQALRPVGRSVRVRMVRLERWELWVAGDPEPYWGIRGDPLMDVERRPDGGYAVLSRATPAEDFRRTEFSADQVRSFGTRRQWYLDDLGGIEAELFAE